MKKLGSILAVVLVLAMVLAMAPAAFAAECPLVDGAAYKISANNADGALWFKGTITGGRFDCSANEADAVEVYVEAVTDGWKMYIKDGAAKKYIVMEDKSAGGKFVDAAADASVFVWNADLNTLVESDPDNARAFGSQDTSTYMNMSCYATSNTSGYNWGVFNAVGGTQNPPAGGDDTQNPPAGGDDTQNPPAGGDDTQNPPAGGNDTEKPDDAGDNTAIVAMTSVMAVAVVALAVLVVGKKKFF